MSEHMFGSGMSITSSIFPACKVGNCCGCQTFPVVIFRLPVKATRWRCAACYATETGNNPFPVATLRESSTDEGRE